MGHCASAPLEAKQRQSSPVQQLEEFAPATGSSSSPVRSRVPAAVESSPLEPGCLVLFEMDQRSTSGRSSAAQQPQDTHFMVRDTQWHSFDVAGFVVESHRGPGGACIYDAVLSGPAAVLAWLQAQAGQAPDSHCQLHGHTRTLRLRWDALQRLQGIKALALAAPSTPFTTTEAARLKAFAASVAQGSKQPRDLSQRARLMSARGRKAFLPRLVGDMLVATGQLQQAGPELVYSSAKHHHWAMPDLHFSGDQLPAHSHQHSAHSSTSGAHHHHHHHLASSIKSRSSQWGSSPLPANMHHHHHHHHPGHNHYQQQQQQQAMPHVTIVTDGGEGATTLANIMSYPISTDNLSPHTSLSSAHTTGRIHTLSPNTSGDFAAKPVTPVAPFAAKPAAADSKLGPSSAQAGVGATVAGPAAEATTSWSMLSKLMTLPSFIALSAAVQQPVSAATATAASSGSSMSMRRQQQVVHAV